MLQLSTIGGDRHERPAWHLWAIGVASVALLLAGALSLSSVSSAGDVEVLGEQLQRDPVAPVETTAATAPATTSPPASSIPTTSPAPVLTTPAPPVTSPPPVRVPVPASRVQISAEDLALARAGVQQATADEAEARSQLAEDQAELQKLYDAGRSPNSKAEQEIVIAFDQWRIQAAIYRRLANQDVVDYAAGRANELRSRATEVASARSDLQYWTAEKMRADHELGGAKAVLAARQAAGSSAASISDAQIKVQSAEAAVNTAATNIAVASRRLAELGG